MLVEEAGCRHQLAVEATGRLRATPLMYAILNNRPECIRYLHEAGAAMDRPMWADDVAMLPIEVAASVAAHDAAVELVAVGSPLGSVKTAHLLLWAAQLGHREAIGRLMEFAEKPDYEAKDSRGHSVLHWACESGNCEIVRMLLSKQVQITPKVLACAVCGGYPIEVTLTLLAHTTEAHVIPGHELRSGDISALPPAVADAVREYRCVSSFLKSQIKQPYFVCHTCSINVTTNGQLCTTCAHLCHAGHAVQPVGSMSDSEGCLCDNPLRGVITQQHWRVQIQKRHEHMSTVDNVANVDTDTTSHGHCICREPLDFAPRGCRSPTNRIARSQWGLICDLLAGNADAAIRRMADDPTADFGRYYDGSQSPITTPLHVCVLAGNANAVSTLVDYYTSQPNAPNMLEVVDCCGHTPLAVAAIHDLPDIVTLLIAKGAIQQPLRTIGLKRRASAEKVAKFLVRRTVDMCGQSPFVDTEFPADERALWCNPTNPLPADVIEHPHRWQHFLASHGYRLFAAEPSAGDIIQGGIGTCYLIGSIAVLASCQPRWLRSLFMAYDESHGVFAVGFYTNGRWSVVIVDAQLPVDDIGTPVFSRSRTDQSLYVALLEKAYAKQYGCYEAINSGVGRFAMTELTGGVCEELSFTREGGRTKYQIAMGVFWNTLLANHKQGKLMTAFIRLAEGEEFEAERAMGLLAGHEYGVLDVRLVDNHKLIKLINPWGQGGEWQGRWSDTSDEWTPELRTLLNHTVADDGIFWMEYSDFVSTFTSINLSTVPVNYLSGANPSDELAAANADGDTAATPTATHQLEFRKVDLQTRPIYVIYCPSLEPNAYSTNPTPLRLTIELRKCEMQGDADPRIIMLLAVRWPSEYITRITKEEQPEVGPLTVLGYDLRLADPIGKIPPTCDKKVSLNLVVFPEDVASAGDVPPCLVVMSSTLTDFGKAPSSMQCDITMYFSSAVEVDPGVTLDMVDMQEDPQPSEDALKGEGGAEGENLEEQGGYTTLEEGEEKEKANTVESDPIETADDDLAKPAARQHKALQPVQTMTRPPAHAVTQRTASRLPRETYAQFVKHNASMLKKATTASRAPKSKAVAEPEVERLRKELKLLQAKLQTQEEELRRLRAAAAKR